MKILFWALFLTIVFHYVIFPCITFIVSLFKQKAVKRKEYFPEVTLIIAAYNEQTIIEKKIMNSFNLIYPKERMNIIVVADGSNDETYEIVEQYKSQGVICLHKKDRKGKTAALNRGVEKATSEIIVFSDANSMYEPDAIKKLVRNFHDNSVGGVCGRKSIYESFNRESSQGDGAFWKIESSLKTMQSNIGSISTGDGEIFAIRRALYEHIPEEVINDDTAITFNLLKKNYRVVYEPEAVSIEESSITIEDDFNVKARMVSGGYQTISLYYDFLFPPKTYFAFQFLSHKLLRWAMPLFLILLLISTFYCSGWFYSVFLLLQSVFYGMALTGYIYKRNGKNNKILYLPYYYCAMNIAALKGLYFFLKGSAGTSIWVKARR